MENIIIRKAQASERDIIVDFQIRMAKETEDLGLDQATLTKGVQRVLEDPSKGTYWVVEYDARIICSVLITHEWSDWRNGEVWWIQSLYVLAPFRGKGIFKQLYAFFKEQVEANEDLKGIRLYVEKENVNAQKAYEAVGMTKEHYDMYEWLK